jgi:sec-independent protein translocase protein TatB
MASEFRGHVDDMMRQAELDELKKQVEAGTKDAVLDLQGLDPTREIKAAIEEGASDAQKEMAAAKASIDASTADALAPPPVSAAELTAPVEEPAALPASAEAMPAEPAFAAVPPASEDSPPVEPEPAPVSAVPAAANEPSTPPPPPQKIAVG